MARSGAGRKIPPGLGRADARQPAAGGARAGLLSPVRDRLQSQANWTRRSASMRSSASSATWPPREGWMPAIEAPASGKRVLVVGAGPSGLSAAYHLTRLGHSVGNPRGGAAAGRHAAFRHSRLPAAARRPDARNRPHRGDGRAHRAEPQGRRISLAEKQAGGFDAAFVAVGAHVSHHIDIPARDAARVLDAVSCCARSAPARNRCSAAAW